MTLPLGDGEGRASSSEAEVEAPASGLEAAEAKLAGGGVPTNTVEIPIERVIPNGSPTRIPGPDRELKALQFSILKYGLFYPILVKPRKGGDFEVQDGDRRFACIKSLRWKNAPCKILDPKSDGKGHAGLIGNLMRKGLSPIERARGYKQLLEDRVFKSREALGRAFGYTGARVIQMLELLRLPEDIQQKVHEGKIAPTVAEAAAKKGDKAQDTLRKKAGEGKKPHASDLPGNKSAPIPEAELVVLEPTDGEEVTTITGRVFSEHVRLIFTIPAKTVGNEWEVHESIQAILRKLDKDAFRTAVRRLRREITQEE